MEMLYTSYLKTMSRFPPACPSLPPNGRSPEHLRTLSRQLGRPPIRDPRGGLASPPCHRALASPRAPWSFGIVGLER